MKPNLWKGFHTMQMNLSTAMSIVAMLDAHTDVMKITPKALQSDDSFHLRAM